jgi:hypothetical protein
VGLAGTAHQTAAEESGIEFIPGKNLLVVWRSPLLNAYGPSSEWFADLDYSAEGKLLITKYTRYPSKYELANVHPKDS